MQSARIAACMQACNQRVSAAGWGSNHLVETVTSALYLIFNCVRATTDELLSNTYTPFKKCVSFHRNVERTNQQEDALVGGEGKKLTDFRLLLSLSKSSDTTSKSKDTEIRSGTPVDVALGMATSIAASPARTESHRSQ
jgi:hypothetical protein